MDEKELEKIAKSCKDFLSAYYGEVRNDFVVKMFLMQLEYHTGITTFRILLEDAAATKEALQC